MISPEEQQFQMQSSLQRQAVEGEQNMNATAMMNNQQQIQAALVEQINPNKILKEIELTLLGQEDDGYGNIKQVRKALMNDKGISDMILITKSIVNQNTIMSALKEDEIGKLMENVTDDIIDKLTLNWKEYGIKDKTDLDTIHNIIVNMSFPALKRALFGGERGFLSKITVENISSTPRNQLPKKQGFLDRFKL